MSTRYDDRDYDRSQRNYGRRGREHDQSSQSGRGFEDERDRYSGEDKWRGQSGGRYSSRMGGDYQSSSRDWDDDREYGSERNPRYGSSGSGYGTQGRGIGESGAGYGNEWRYGGEGRYRGQGRYGESGYGQSGWSSQSGYGQGQGRGYGTESSYFQGGQSGHDQGSYQGGWGSPGGWREGGYSGEGGYGREGGREGRHSSQRYNYPSGYRSGERYGERGRMSEYDRGEYGEGEERGWWDRASDAVASWFGDEEAERRRRMDEQRPHRGRGPKGYRRSDERIKEDVNDRLSEGYIDASEITVMVEGGEVTLSGTVNSRSDKRRAEDIAEYVSGVQNVENRLRVKETHRYGTSTGAGLTGTSGATGTELSGVTSTPATTSAKGKTAGSNT
ncbi:MAG TPA: BON domain-containing protein [Pyrinomonadaceae bacterium]|nr:BON domain-containing protein [Pyrinomonadaceae bacterium]